MNWSNNKLSDGTTLYSDETLCRDTNDYITTKDGLWRFVCGDVWIYRMFKFLCVVQTKIEGRGPGDLVPQIGNSASSSSYSWTTRLLNLKAFWCVAPTSFFVISWNSHKKKIFVLILTPHHILYSFDLFVCQEQNLIRLDWQKQRLGDISNKTKLALFRIRQNTHRQHL